MDITKASLLFLTSTSTLIGCYGFLQQPSNIAILAEHREFILQAKAAKKNKRKKAATASRGAGFGKVAEESRPKKTDDFSVFPALEKDVAETLVASPLDLQTMPGELPEEIFARLDQIYGFPKFNHEVSEEEQDDGEPISFDALISTGEADSASSGNGSTLSDSDFSDLLASATGGSSSRPTLSSDNTKSNPEEKSNIGAIASLPPFEQLRVLHMDPLVIAVDGFLTEEECERYIGLATAPNKNTKDSPFQTQSKTVGKDALAKAQRTSTTWFHHYKNAPELMAKASRLVGLENIDQWEEPQTVRYRRQEKFTWHLDALSPAEASSNLAGQRIATLIVYLTDLESSEGGATIFRDLSADGSMLKVQPKKGSALLFFPAAGGIPNAPLDIRTLHCGEAVNDSSASDKWISQLWLREGQYNPSAPSGNLHSAATEAITEYCSKVQ